VVDEAPEAGVRRPDDVAPGANLSCLLVGRRGRGDLPCRLSRSPRLFALLTAVMLLRYVGMPDDAARLEPAIAAVYADGSVLTPD
jgi:hypothetical protein